MNRTLRDSVNIATILSRIYRTNDVWTMKSFSWGVTLKKLLRYWNETWYLCSYQCRYFYVDQKRSWFT